MAISSCKGSEYGVHVRCGAHESGEWDGWQEIHLDDKSQVINRVLGHIKNFEH